MYCRSPPVSWFTSGGWTWVRTPWYSMSVLVEHETAHIRIPAIRRFFIYRFPAARILTRRRGPFPYFQDGVNASTPCRNLASVGMRRPVRRRVRLRASPDDPLRPPPAAQGAVPPGPPRRLEPPGLRDHRGVAGAEAEGRGAGVDRKRRHLLRSDAQRHARLVSRRRRRKPVHFTDRGAGGASGGGPGTVPPREEGHRGPSRHGLVHLRRLHAVAAGGGPRAGRGGDPHVPRRHPHDALPGPP